MALRETNFTLKLPLYHALPDLYFPSHTSPLVSPHLTLSMALRTTFLNFSRSRDSAGEVGMGSTSSVIIYIGET
ncbi:hypothetical protein E2C01_079688 [Portunus trituberculatus]|uniref:Uncharacterized protein n=1 Tax=Portunus trituberculatus TaxID=210409 RepID=A0A5B7IXN4_PORTR|nr:hypothetical protein [Portunus trituberculatus]